MGSASELVGEIFSALCACRLVLLLASGTRHITGNADIGVLVVPGHALGALIFTVASRGILPEVFFLRKALQPAALAVSTIIGKTGTARVLTVQPWVEYIVR